MSSDTIRAPRFVSAPDPVEVGARAIPDPDPEQEVRASTARELYEDYAASTGGVSAVTGAKLPDFAACPEAVRRAWQHTAEQAARRAGLPLPAAETP